MGRLGSEIEITCYALEKIRKKSGLSNIGCQLEEYIKHMQELEYKSLSGYRQ
ncbi:hypothetical protein DSUL_140081 [Desulfovibrionales bacterium]